MPTIGSGCDHTSIARSHPRLPAGTTTILSLSSQVAYGHIGHSAAVFIWQRLGLHVIALPTVILSNRPDYAHRAGMHVPPDTLAAMLQAIEANGWLEEIDAVFTGYMPTPMHAALAAEWTAKLKAAKPGLVYSCDPILGDDPGGLYIDPGAAAAIRDMLAPLADVITPNCFELGWLARTRVTSSREAAAAASKLTPVVLTTSLPCGEGKLANLLSSQGKTWHTEVTRRETVAHGTGDAMAALFLGHYLRERSWTNALALATTGLEAIIEASQGYGELRMPEAQNRWNAPESWPLYEGI